MLTESKTLERFPSRPEGEIALEELRPGSNEGKSGTVFATNPGFAALNPSYACGARFDGSFARKEALS
jgi:hypothetical protein